MGGVVLGWVRSVRERYSDRTIALGVAVAIVAGGALVIASVGGVDREEPAPEPVLFEPPPVTTTTERRLTVHAAGAVQAPGLYRVPGGARVADVIEAAGGVDGSVDIDRVNLAAAVADGERVYIPRIGEMTPTVAGAPDRAEGGGSEQTPLDLNLATQQQLEDLPGIGPSTAASILRARSEAGRFTSIEDLLDVRGIGEAKLGEIRDLVTVR